MKFSISQNIDKSQWNKLVLKHQGNYFSYSLFLDVCSKKWGIFHDDSYTKGFAICYNEIFGVKILYPPIFGRTVDFFNLSKDEIQQALEKVKSEFKIGFLQTESELSFANKIQKTYQTLIVGHKFNNLSERMVKKAKKANYFVENCNFQEILPIIEKELVSKISILNTENLKRLEHLLKDLELQKQLLSLGIYDENKIVCGGLLFAKNSEKYFYIIGTGEDISKKNGGIYLAMEKAINTCLKENKTLDFGGSNIPSIRQFYLNLGGIDQHYYSYSWDNSPFWFKLIRRMKKKISSF